jgi:hypothetical protein
MTPKLHHSLLLVLSLLGAASLAAEPSVISLDGSWQLAEGSFDQRPAAFDRTVPVPGTAIDALPPLASYRPRSEEGLHGKPAPARPENERALWYRRLVTLDGPLPEVARLTIHKARWGVKAWVNGQEAGEHHLIRTAARFDVRQHLRGDGAENEIVLRLGATQNEVPPEIPAFAAWTGNVPGLYDSVHLTLCDSPQVQRVQVVPDIVGGSVILAVTLRHISDVPAEASLHTRILEDGTGRVVATAPATDVLVSAGGETAVDLTIPLPGAKPWSPETPFLYRFELEVRADGAVTDTHQDRFGMRSFRIDPKTGRALVNGVPVLLRGAGVLNVVDFLEDPACGRKPWDEAWVRRALLQIKEMNGNAARFAFDHPPRIWYRIADEIGLLIQDEARSGLTKDVTADALAAQLAGHLHEHANHPSVVIWDASNETPADDVRGSHGRIEAAIERVRPLDRSNRPWDNSWAPTGVPGDVSFEVHPYLGWRSGYSQSSFPVQAKMGDWPGKYQDHPVETLPPGFILNEYCGMMLTADGTPSHFSKTFFNAFLAPASTAAGRFLIRARFSAMESEYWRRVPGVCGVMINPYLHGSGRSYIHDIEKPEIDPVFLRFVRDAYAPVSVMVDHWATQVAPGTQLNVPVSIANDSPQAWSGEVRLHLLRAGRNLAKTSALFEPPADEGALHQATILTQRQNLSTVALMEQKSITFTIPVPAEPGHFHLMAEITGESGTPVRSWRDFKTSN